MKATIPYIPLLRSCVICYYPRARSPEMSSTQPDKILRLLQRWSDGESSARDELLPLVYDDLRRLAQSRLRREGSSITIEPTVLVHEAFIKIVGERRLAFEGRAQFFALASTIMRNIVVDYCRSRKRAKRWGEGIRVSISQIDRQMNLNKRDFLQLHEALEELATIKPLHARAVECRFFGGLSVTETAEVLDVSPATVERYWKFSRAWLADELSRRDSGEGEPH